MSINISQLGKGVLPDPPDSRDYRFAFVAAGAPPVDWNKGFRLSEPPNTNQGTSDACVGEATSSLHWQLKKKQFSVRSVFAYIYLSYGAYLRDGVRRVVEHGQETLAEAPDPNPKTMTNMRNKAGLNPANAIDDQEADYWLEEDSIDRIAMAVRDHKGCVFGIYGHNAGWSDFTNPIPPQAGQAEWGHAIYAMGYHMHFGQKCIIAKSSWSDAQPGHHEHHIKENYFNAGAVFNAWILVRKDNLPMIRRFKVNDHGKLGVMLIVDGTFDSVTYWAKNEAMYARLLVDYEVPADALTITVP